MKTLLVSLSILSTALLSSCVITETPGYTTSNTPTGFYDSSWSNVYYTGFGYTNWYAGTPDYFAPSIYSSDW